MENRSVRDSTFQALMSRARSELNSEYFKIFERYYKRILTEGHSPETLYGESTRGLKFLKYAQNLGTSLNELTLDEIDDFIASRGNASNKRWLCNNFERNR